MFAEFNQNLSKGKNLSLIQEINSLNFFPFIDKIIKNLYLKKWNFFLIFSNNFHFTKYINSNRIQAI